MHMETNDPSKFKAPRRQSWAVAVDQETHELIGREAQRSGRTISAVARAAFMAYLTPVIRVETRPACSHGTDSQHDE